MPHEIHSFSLTVVISFILTLSICLSITIFCLYFLVLLFLFLLLFRRLLIENTDTLNLLNVTFFHTHYFLSHWFFWITIISIKTTFCNFLNIIKLYRREQRAVISLTLPHLTFTSVASPPSSASWSLSFFFFFFFFFSVSSFSTGLGDGGSLSSELLASFFLCKVNPH